MQDYEFIKDVFLKKNLVVDTCEPFLEKKTVKLRQKTAFKMFCFGRFEFDDKEFIYGTEVNNYNKLFKDKNASTFPIVFAQIKHTPTHKTFYELAPKGDFSDQDIELIVETITHTLEGRQVMAHYGTRCVD